MCIGTYETGARNSHLRIRKLSPRAPIGTTTPPASSAVFIYPKLSDKLLLLIRMARDSTICASSFGPFCPSPIRPPAIYALGLPLENSQVRFASRGRSILNSTPRKKISWSLLLPSPSLSSPSARYFLLRAQRSRKL